MTTPIIQTGAKKLDQLQFLRYLAFFFVFSLHTNRWTQDWYNVTNLCLSSISFFFILSGFVTGYNSRNKKIELTWESWKSDIKKKLIKIYPLYILTLSISLCFYGGLSQALIYSSYGQIDSLISKFLKCVFLLQSWFPTDYFYIYAITWFVSTIMFLYTISLPLLHTFKKIGSKENGTKIISIIALCTYSFTFCYCYLTKDLNTEYWQYVFPLSRLGEFTLGICLGLLFYPLSDYVSRSRVNNTIVFTIAETAALIGFFVYVNNVSEFTCGPRLFTWIIPNLLLITVFMIGRGYISKLFSTKPLLTLGNASFELYLIHCLVIREYVSFNDLEISDYALVINFWLCLIISTAIGLYIHKQTNKNHVS